MNLQYRHLEENGSLHGWMLIFLEEMFKEKYVNRYTIIGLSITGFDKESLLASML